MIRDLVADPARYRTTTPPPDGKKVLADLRIRYILIPHDERDLERYVAELKLPLVYEDALLKAYQVY